MPNRPVITTMTDPPHIPTPPEEFRAILRAALTRGARMTPLCRAVAGWMSETTTEPSVAEIRVGGDGRVRLRLSDEADAEPTGSFLEFLEQVHILCVALGMTESQAQQAVGWAQFRLF